MKINIETPNELLDFLQRFHNSGNLQIDQLELILSTYLKIYIDTKISIDENLRRFKKLVKSGKLDESAEIQLFL